MKKVWNTKAPKGPSKPLTKSQKADAKARAAAIRSRSPIRLSAEVERLIQQAAQAHGTPDDITAWAERLARDVRDLSD